MLGERAVPAVPAHGIKAVIIQVGAGHQDNPTPFDDLVAKSLNYQPELIMLGLPSEQSPIDQLSGEAREHQFYLLHGTEFLSPDGKRSHHDVTYHFMNIPDGFSPWEPSRIISPSVDTFDTTFGKVSSLICMESAYPYPARKVVSEGIRVLTTTSLNQGFAFAGLLGGNAVYRAVEFGIPAVSYRAWGGSFIVGPHGRIVEDQAPEAEIVAGVIPPPDHETFYGRYGDIFSYVIILLMAGLVGYNFYLARKSPFRYCKECGAQLPKTRQACEQCQSSAKPTWWRRILSLIGP